jgi:transcriptional activator SPT8
MEDVGDDAEPEEDENDEEGDDEDAEGDDDDGEGEGEDGENDDDEDQDEAESPSAQRMQNRLSSRPLTSPRPLANGSAAHSRHGSGNVQGVTSPPPHPSALPFRPSIRPEAISATTYDIVPTIAAPQSTSINAIAATPDMRWVFSGGTDGYIRKFNWPDSANGKLALTVAQRHPFVDSVTKAGVLLSYWENEESTSTASSWDTYLGLTTPPDDTPSRQHSFDEPVSLSPVYSLAVQNQAMWLLSGTEYGGINLQSVRHNEGTRITTLRKHTSAVSVLHLAPDEKSVLSGSWDKTLLDWDLNTGSIIRSFAGGGGQISAIQPRPQSSLPVPEELGTSLPSGTFSSNNASQLTTNGASANTAGDESNTTGSTIQNEDGLQDAPADDDDMNSLFGDDNDAGGLEPPMQLGDVEDDEFSRAIAEGLQQPTDEDAPGDIDMTEAGGPVQPPTTSADDQTVAGTASAEETQIAVNGMAEDKANTHTRAETNGLPHSTDEEAKDGKPAATVFDVDKTPSSDTTFLDACFDGTIRVWDRRKPNPIARIRPPQGTPPWCMSACWGTDGNHIYAGRRNNCVEEYSLHKGLRTPERTFRFPAGSGPVSAVAAMPNGRHLIW